MATASNSEVKPALLFMPDISGFTQFVSDNEILHSQHIVQELLENIIDSNHLNMEVGDIEGDAVFFYRIGERPSAKDLLKQVESMYIKFHQHLSMYDHQRFCNCAACKSAINLTLKVIAHYGEIAQHNIKEHKKVFGKDVIVLHRLLKNNLGQNEYVLMTTPLLNGEEDIKDPNWVSMQAGTETYDAGEVNFGYSILSELRKQVPPPEYPTLKSFENTTVSFKEEGIIDADLLDVFWAIADLEHRTNWMAGVKSIEVLGHHKLNREGTQHRCIVGAKNNPLIVTESMKMESGRAELIEMDSKGMGGCRFIVEQLEPGRSKLTAEVIVKKSPMVKLMFNLMMKNKFRARIRQSIENLKVYCSTATPQLMEA